MTPTADFFRALERQRTRALVVRDIAVIERLHAPDYQLITPAGRTIARARYLELLTTEPFYTGWELGTIEVRVSAAMAILRYPAALSFPSGKLVRCWHTDSYEPRDGQWQAVWSQATQRPDEAAS